MGAPRLLSAIEKMPLGSKECVITLAAASQIDGAIIAGCRDPCRLGNHDNNAS